MVVKSKLFHRFAGNPKMLRMMMKSAPAMDRLAHRLTGGRFTMSGSVMPIMVLDTIGSKSGQPRTSPLQYVKHGNDFLVIGSNFGGPAHPAWSTNLMKTPDATAALGGKRFPVTARLLTGAERDEAWRVALEQWPPFQNYVAQAGAREFRIFLLVPKESPAA